MDYLLSPEMTDQELNEALLDERMELIYFLRERNLLMKFMDWKETLTPEQLTRIRNFDTKASS